MAKAATTTKKTKTEQKAEPARVKTPRVTAGPCIKSPSHEHTRVYKTKGKTRYCKCDDCGSTWKIVADHADDLHQYLIQLADDLDDAGRIEGEGGPVIVLTDKVAREIAKDLRDLVETAA